MQINITPEKVKLWSELGSRGAYGQAMMMLGEEREDVIAMTADLSDATRITQFRKKYPDRFFNIGIAEQNLVGVGAGMSMRGYTVFCTSFAAFISMRSCEQVRTDVGYQKANVKLIGADGGLVMGTLGNTHYALEDVGVIRSMPNLTILSPADGVEIVKATLAAAEFEGPVYIRLTGGKNNPVVYQEDYPFEIGKAVWLKRGEDMTMIAAGTMVYEAMQAAEILKEQGVDAGVLNMHTIKPLDEAAVKECMAIGPIVTVEEHSVLGGLGAAVCEVACEKGAVVHRIGIPDAYGPIGTYQEQLARYGLKGKQIAEKIQREYLGKEA